jgi:hypothetical protein
MEDILTNPGLWLLVKYPVFLLLLLYIVFAVVIIKQVRLMVRTLKVGTEGLLVSVAYLHLVAAIIVLMAAVILL